MGVGSRVTAEKEGEASGSGIENLSGGGGGCSCGIGVCSGKEGPRGGGHDCPGNSAKEVWDLKGQD